MAGQLAPVANKGAIRPLQVERDHRPLAHCTRETCKRPPWPAGVAAVPRHAGMCAVQHAHWLPGARVAQGRQLAGQPPARYTLGCQRLQKSLLSCCPQHIAWLMSHVAQQVKARSRSADSTAVAAVLPAGSPAPPQLLPHLGRKQHLMHTFLGCPGVSWGCATW